MHKSDDIQLEIFCNLLNHFVNQNTLIKQPTIVKQEQKL
jgi:hypothetical protein